MSDLISRQRILRIITGAYVKSKGIDSFYALLQTAFGNILPDAQVEQDCVLKQFGDCSYAETGCSDCAITAKIRKALKTAQPDLLEDGTLMITVPQDMLGDVKRVMVDEVGTKFCKVMYQDEPELQGEWVDAKDGYDGHVKCNKCFKTYDWTRDAQYFDYCPNCGSYNGGGR